LLVNSVINELVEGVCVCVLIVVLW